MKNIIASVIISVSICLVGWLWFHNQSLTRASLEAKQEAEFKIRRAELLMDIEKERKDDCDDQIADAKKRWNNVYSGYFDSDEGACYVNYKNMQTGEIDTADVLTMGDN